MIIKVLLTVVFSLISAVLTWLCVLGLKTYLKWYKKKHGYQEGEEKKDRKDRFNEFPWAAFFSGFVEVVLYSGSMLAGKPEFIAIWLGVKTALKWDRTDKKKLEEVNQRATYLTYLIGTGLNIILAYVSASLVKGQLIAF